jgi:hypothetical protein
LSGRKGQIEATRRAAKIPSTEGGLFCSLSIRAILKLTARGWRRIPCVFSFYHAGGLDPDGILILQNIRDIAEKPVSPIAMNAVIFDRYLPWAGPLTGNMPDQTKKRSVRIQTIPGLEDLIRSIVKTGRGAEQEIIDSQAWVLHYHEEGKFFPAG